MRNPFVLKKRKNKYNAQKIVRDGMEFDSHKEYRRWQELALLLKAGVISDLERQVKFTLIPTQREVDSVGPRGGIKRGKVIEQECAYVADFVYRDSDGVMVVEDVKSEATRTPEYIIKRKLLLYIHGIRIKEV